MMPDEHEILPLPTTAAPKSLDQLPEDPGTRWGQEDIKAVRLRCQTQLKTQKALCLQRKTQEKLSVSPLGPEKRALAYHCVG